MERAIKVIIQSLDISGKTSTVYLQSTLSTTTTEQYHWTEAGPSHLHSTKVKKKKRDWLPAAHLCSVLRKWSDSTHEGEHVLK